MTEQERYWIIMSRSYPDDYVIVVDNDAAFVESTKDMKCVFEFEHYGWRLALDLLRYIGCNAEEA